MGSGRKEFTVEKNILKTIAALLVLGVLSAPAQVVVSKSAGDKVGVDLSGVTAAGAAASAVRKTFENNIARSGWMAVAAPGKGAIVVRGAIAESGGQVSFTCVATDPAGRVYLNAAYAQLLAEAEGTDAEMKTLGSAAPAQVPALREMQRSWIAFRDAACGYEASRWGGGSGAGPAASACVMELTARQALRLIAYAGQQG